MVQLTHRNTRRNGGESSLRVGGVIIGFGGAAFNLDKEQEMGSGDKHDHRSLHSDTAALTRTMTRPTMPRVGGARRLQRRQADRYHDSVRRFLQARQQTSTMPDIRSGMNEDLYLCVRGTAQDNGPHLGKRY